MKASETRLGIALVLIGSLGGCSASNSGADGVSVQRTAVLPTPEILAAIPDAAAFEYRVGPLDTIEVSVFQVPDLSKTVQVSA